MVEVVPGVVSGLPVGMVPPVIPGSLAPTPRTYMHLATVPEMRATKYAEDVTNCTRMGTLCSMASSVAFGRVPIHVDRAGEPAPAAAAPRPHRLGLVAACYIGLAMIVALTVAVHEFVPTPVAAPVFLAACIALVAGLHPRARRRAVSRR